ncbi:MAG: fructosamine kinase family protein [Actinomycetota bacterium]|nr:fructosamine kinase family protein [Actinomycetota bacterium]
MSAALPPGLAGELGAEAVSARVVSGGDIAAARRVDLADGRTVFVKTLEGAPADFFAAEAAGLAWLAEPGAIAVAEVVAVAADGLALTFVHGGPPAPDHDERLGRGLAALHRAGAAAFGWDRPGFIGSLPLDNTPADEWGPWWVERRLRPYARLGVERGACDGSVLDRLDRLEKVIDDRAGPPEPPARIHGDLWAGNRMVADDGAPMLIDPAAHGGHRETDLAMMALFGGYGPRVFSAYEEAWPLADGAEGRVPLHQLHPLLVHVALFGASYAVGVDRALGDLGC